MALRTSGHTVRPDTTRAPVLSAAARAATASPEIRGPGPGGGCPRPSKKPTHGSLGADRTSDAPPRPGSAAPGCRAEAGRGTAIDERPPTVVGSCGRATLPAPQCAVTSACGACGDAVRVTAHRIRKVDPRPVAGERGRCDGALGSSSPGHAVRYATTPGVRGGPTPGRCTAGGTMVTSADHRRCRCLRLACGSCGDAQVCDGCPGARYGPGGTPATATGAVPCASGTR